MARGFGIGDFAKAFNTTYDTVNKVAQDFEVAKIVNDKPVDETALSSDQNEQVFQELADGGTARDVKNDDGSFGGVAVTKPLADGVEGPAQVKTLEPQKITKYLGKEFVGGLDPAKATSLRNRALAGVITRADPLQGIKLDAALTQTEREEQDYGDKQQVRTLQRQFTAERDPFKRAEIGRKLAALPGGGDVVKGFGDIDQANYRAVVNHARGFLAKGDVKGAMNVYNQYDNGEDGEVVEIPGGGYQLNFYQGKPGGDNKPTSTMSFKSQAELSQWFDDQFDPEAAVRRRAEAAASLAKFSSEVAKAGAIERVKQEIRAGTLKPGYRWGKDGDGNYIQIRADAGSSGRSAGGKATGSGSGIPMKDADRIIARHFTAKDAMTGANRLNTVAASSVRMLLPMTQAAASGDAVGASYEAIQRYEAVLERAGGDHAKAAQMVRSIIDQRPGSKPSATPAQPAAAPAPQGRGGVVLSQDSIDRINRGELKTAPNPFK